MEDAELLKEVKTRLLVTGSYHDNLFMGYIKDVKDYLLSAGVKPRVINGTSSIGCIARGVADLWNYGAGEGRFSESFNQRLIQLSLPDSGMEDGSEDFDPIPEDVIDGVVGETGFKPEPDYDLVTPEDIDKVTDSSSNSNKPAEPVDPGLDEDEYEEFTKEEIDEVLKTL